MKKLPYIYLLLLATTLAAQPQRQPGRKSYTTEQATSDRAQLHTLAFDGLAFVTGSFGADCFFPPGKVADFFGFQYMRDNDSNSLGHNTDFLTRIATNVISILNPQQLDQLKALAREQESIYDDFARKRIVLISGFRKAMEERRNLNKDAVIAYCNQLYGLDAALSIRRAEVVAAVIRSFSQQQIDALNKLSFGNSATWPAMAERLDKQGLSHWAHVGVMTYSSELFSWYKGSLAADVYFCPERHGTYFGGFYLKDYPAMGNKGYSISTSLTGDAGKAFLDALTAEQRSRVEGIVASQRPYLQEIVRLREQISTNLRMYLNGQQPDKKQTENMIRKYGEQDGALSYLYAQAFAYVNQTLSPTQREKLKALRNLDVVPQGIYIYSDPAPMPPDVECGFLLEKK